MRERKFTLLCEIVRNVHLLKPHGMIPFMLHKMYGYDSGITTYDYKDFTYQKQEVKGLKLNFLKKLLSYKNRVPMWLYLLKNAKNIDVLMVYNIKKRPIYNGLLYKFLNPNGFLYAKADTGRVDFGFYVDTAGFPYKNYMTWLGNKFLQACDVVSVENLETYNKNIQVPKEKLIYLPNGFDADLLKLLDIKIRPFEERSNTILHVSRMGEVDKNSELLLEALSLIKDLGGWKVVFIGSENEKFLKFKEEIFAKHPHVKESIVFKGVINNKKDLFEEYNDSKIYCLSSRAEAFNNAIVEAQFFGNSLIGTEDINCVRDVTDNGRLGELFENENPKSLALKIEKMIGNEERLKTLHNENLEFSRENFTWQKIIPKLHEKIEEKLGEPTTP